MQWLPSTTKSLNSNFSIYTMNKPIKHIAFVLALFLTPFFSFSQTEIQGYWTGTLNMATGGCFAVYNIEFQLQVVGDKINGYSFHYTDTSTFVREDFVGKIDSGGTKINIQEHKVSLYKIPGDCVPCLKNYTLKVSETKDGPQLSGSWTGKKLEDGKACPGGVITLRKIAKPVHSGGLATSIVEKKNILSKEILVDTGTIRLSFYDNGQIDGDIISVYINNQLVVSSQILGSKPITTVVRIDKTNPIQEVIMVGENLGKIPPNTALMIIDANDRQYKLFLKADNQKNAMVRIVTNTP